MTDLPTVRPFAYVYIPVDSSAPAEQRQFTGDSEEAMRTEFTRHFRSFLLSEDQQKRMAEHITAEAEKNADSQRRNKKDDDEVAEENKKTEEDAQAAKMKQIALINQYLESNAYEIVPVQMPMRKTKFIGTSLYIDDSGQFKGLEINTRASKIAQREIRGDAFLLSNHDDPALENWERVDTTLETYEDFLANPPKEQPVQEADMKKFAQYRENESKRIEEEDVVKAAMAKNEGNKRVQKGDWNGGVEAYDVAITLLEGRRDLLQDEKAATELRISALLNRSMCFAKLSRYREAVKDAENVLTLAPGHVKALYRLAQGQIGAQEFEEAKATVDQFAKIGGAEDVAALQSALKTASQAFHAKQKKMFANMFS